MTELNHTTPDKTTEQTAEHTHNGKRTRTIGENLFDATTYGGLALLGNELTAASIIGTAEKGLKPEIMNKPVSKLSVMDSIRGAVGKSYIGFDKFVQKLNKDRFAYFKPHGEDSVSRFTYIAFAIIGGFVMVPFIRALEDNKGKAVKFADRFIHGKKAETDPNMVEAHKEMEEAPKQTWESLLKGRLLTVGAAYAVDATVNYEHGLSSKLFPKLEKWNSLETISKRFTNWASGHIAEWRKLTPAKAASQAEFIGTTFSLLTFSAALTLLFYGTSKAFAHGQEKKRIIKTDPARAHQLGYRDESDVTPASANENIKTANDTTLTTEAPETEAPRTRVGMVESLSRVNDAPQTSMQAGA